MNGPVIFPDLASTMAPALVAASMKYTPAATHPQFTSSFAMAH